MITPRRGRVDEGQAAVLTIAVVAVSLVMTQQLVRLAMVVTDVARAQSIADATVLALANAGDEEARLVARFNGGELTATRAQENTWEVEVLVDGVPARARAGA